jgi:hypothetical protein
MERLLLEHAHGIEQRGANSKVDEQIAEGRQVGVLEAMFGNSTLNRFELCCPLIFIWWQNASGADHQRAALLRKVSGCRNNVRVRSTLEIDVP